MIYRALLIGNSVFDADAGLLPLNAPIKDVSRLHRALVDPAVGMFEDAHVRIVNERTNNDILDELDQFFSEGGKDDLLLLYYSGHGVLDERNRLYLCGRDTQSDRLLRTAVSNTRINEFIGQSACQRTVILLDCCSSGMFKGAQVGAQLAGPGRYIVSSTRGAALANDAATATGTSLFTDYLVEALLGGAADVNGDGYVDLREVYDFVRDRLRATSNQVPHCRFDGDGGVAVARVPAHHNPHATGSANSQRWTVPTFALSENVISLLNVDVDEVLPDEEIEVYPFTEEPLDLEARSTCAWIDTDLTDPLRLVIRLRPPVGRNRGKIIVRDGASGATQVVRVEVFVRAADATEQLSGLKAAAATPSAGGVQQDEPLPNRAVRVPPVERPMHNTGPPIAPAPSPPQMPPPVAESHTESPPVSPPQRERRRRHFGKRAVLFVVFPVTLVIAAVAIAVIVLNQGISLRLAHTPARLYKHPSIYASYTKIRAHSVQVACTERDGVGPEQDPLGHWWYFLPEYRRWINDYYVSENSPWKLPRC